MNAPTFRRHRRGVSAVELAASVTLLCAILLGVIELSRLGMSAQLLTNAAREGCRVAVIQNSALSDVQTRLNTMLSPAGITPGTISVVDSDPGSSGVYLMPSNWNTVAGNAPITLTVRLPFKQVSWTGAAFYLTTASVAGTATFNSERP